MHAASAHKSEKELTRLKRETSRLQAENESLGRTVDNLHKTITKLHSEVEYFYKSTTSITASNSSPVESRYCSSCEGKMATHGDYCNFCGRFDHDRKEHERISNLFQQQTNYRDFFSLDPKKVPRVPVTWLRQHTEFVEAYVVTMQSKAGFTSPELSPFQLLEKHSWGDRFAALRMLARFFEWVFGDDDRTHQIFQTPYFWLNGVVYRAFFTMIVASKLFTWCSIAGIFSQLHQILRFVSKRMAWARKMKSDIKTACDCLHSIFFEANNKSLTGLSKVRKVSNQLSRGEFLLPSELSFVLEALTRMFLEARDVIKTTGTFWG